MPREVQRFEVTLKAFIVRDAKVLLVREADTGYWELPGGRIDVGEEWLPHETVLAREIAEELGPSLEVTPTAATVTWTRQRPTDDGFVFAVGRVCLYAGGELRLSDEHSEFAWRDEAGCTSIGFPPLSGYPRAMAALWRLAHAP